ncbi:MAG: transcriptional regulator [Spirochaetaceae bacterium]|nr:transcriptional regulator [Spirochaetaceae bacterium]
MEQSARAAQSSIDFNRARIKALLWQALRFMYRRDKDALLSFNEVKALLKPKRQVYLGMQAVPLTHIVGSEGRCRDFNRHFFPRSEFLRSRWERVDQARLEDIPLPPVALYEIGGVYFVRDGNHRVSVARSQGIEMIDAEVVSLSSEIAVSPSMTASDLRRAVIRHEKRRFYEESSFGALTGDYGLDFSAPGRYEMIYRHILTHKYYINQRLPQEIPFSDGLFSWYGEVYTPSIEVIRAELLTSAFPGSTESDLYLRLADHWDLLKRRTGGARCSLPAAARDFAYPAAAASSSAPRKAPVFNQKPDPSGDVR